MQQSKRALTPSRFNAITHNDEGQTVLYNSYTGAIACFEEHEKQELMEALAPNSTIQDPLASALKEQGFMIDDRVNEDRRASFLHQSFHRTDYMHLIILPTEACNFRCTYCYQSFTRGSMPTEIQGRVKRFVEKQMPSLKNIHISWFGGEPLLAMNTIRELSENFLTHADHHQTQYSAEISTNGFLLTPEVFLDLLHWQVNRFMITLDGQRKTHDSRRHLATGEDTFSKIMENLLAIKKLPHHFEIHIRVNFDHDTMDGMTDFIAELGVQFGGDPRFQLFFRPVGRWGGPNDEHLSICDAKTADTKIWDYTEQAMTSGLQMSSNIESSLQPGGSVCYAAKPQSFVIGTEGQLYKCTCALEEEFNKVGFILSDGSLEVDIDKLAMWVSSGEETDAGCQACFFRPACQGNHCPLYRFRTGQRPCPYEKRKIKKVLKLIHKNYQWMDENERR